MVRFNALLILERRAAIINVDADPQRRMATDALWLESRQRFRCLSVLAIGQASSDHHGPVKALPRLTAGAV